MDLSHEIVSRLGRIEGKLDEMVTIKEDLNDHDRRLTAVERWQWRTVGVVAAWSAMIGLVLTWLGCTHGK